MEWLKEELGKLMNSNDLDICDGCVICGSLKIEWLCVMCDRHLCSLCKETHDPVHVTQPLVSLALMGKCALHAYIEDLHRKKMERAKALEEYRKSALEAIKKEEERTNAKIKAHFEEQERKIQEEFNSAEQNASPGAENKPMFKFISAEELAVKMKTSGGDSESLESQEAKAILDKLTLEMNKLCQTQKIKGQIITVENLDCSNAFDTNTGKLNVNKLPRVVIRYDLGEL